jgi:hypothetical protein
MEQYTYVVIEHTHFRNILAITHSKEQAEYLLNIFHTKLYKPWAFVERYMQHPGGMVLWDGYHIPMYNRAEAEPFRPLYRSSSEQSFEEHYF